MGLIAFLKNKFSRKKEEEKLEEPVSSEEVVEEGDNPAEEEPSSSILSTQNEPETKEESSFSIENKEEKELGSVKGLANEPASIDAQPEKDDKAEAPIEPKKAEPDQKKEDSPRHETAEFPKAKQERAKTKEEIKEEKKKEAEKEKQRKQKAAEKEKEAKALEKYEKGLAKSRRNFASRLESLSKRYARVNGDYFEELEQILIESDVGVELSINLIEDLLNWSEKEKVTDPAKINEQLIDNMFVDYATKGESIENEISFAPNGPTVLLVVGVNGVGKTTSIAKLAYRYMQKGKKVLLVAGDTFRAGATAQLSIWAQRLGCPIIMGKENGDPASVAYDGCRYAKENGIDLMIVDTAGRQQTKANLMQELAKINRVLGREIEGAPHDSFLIIDGTTGQNGVLQAKAFKEVTALTGIVITKMDGTSKGGIILSIRDELGIPVRFIGLGEKMEDLQEFDLDKYLYGLLLGEQYDE